MGDPDLETDTTIEDEQRSAERAKRAYNYTVVALYVVLIGVNVALAVDTATEGELGRWWEARVTRVREKIRVALEAHRTERQIRREEPFVVFEALQALDGEAAS